MFHLHILGLLTVELASLIAAIALNLYINKQQAAKWYRNIAKGIVITLIVIIIATIVHVIIHHLHAGHSAIAGHQGITQHSTE